LEFFGLLLLLLEGIAERLTPEQLRAILAHELSHVRRRDNLTGFVHMLVEAVFWFHPLVWWIGTRLVEEREPACGEEVLRPGSEPEVYAQGILNARKLYVESPLVCASGVTGADIKKRIEAIMSERAVLKLNFANRVALTSVGMAALAAPVVFGIVYAPFVRAQSNRPQSQAPTFEVASVKPAAPFVPVGRGGRGGGVRTHPQILTARNTTLKRLLILRLSAGGLPGVGFSVSGFACAGRNQTAPALTTATVVCYIGSGDPMLELRNVTKTFLGITAVCDVTFTARAGEITGYLGPNGSGKSTTMKMITALIEPASGSIRFNGQLIQHDLIAYKQRMGYVPEEPHLYGHLSGLEYLVMVGQLRNLPAKPTAERIDGLLRLLALHGDRHSPISAYSKGMRQKILLSAALLHNPDLILLDEPFSGLDVATGLVLRSLIQELASRGKVVLFSSHDLEIVERVCSHVVILHRGKIVADDSIEHLRTLMALPTLEEIFSQLAVEQDTVSISRQIADLIQA